MVIDHDPIACLAEFVGALRIREQQRELPVAALGMQDWQPSFPGRIEALGRNLAQYSGCGLAQVLLVRLQEELDGGAVVGAWLRK